MSKKKSNSHCTGCPLFTLCLGVPQGITDGTMVLCYRCLHLYFYFGDHRVSVLDTCRELYMGMVSHLDLLKACGHTPKCVAEGTHILKGAALHERLQLVLPDIETLTFRGDPNVQRKQVQK